MRGQANQRIYLPEHLVNMFQNKSRIIKILKIALPCVLILTPFIVLITVNAVGENNNSGDDDTSLLIQFQEKLNTVTDPEIRKALEGKINTLQHEATQRAIILQSPKNTGFPCEHRPTVSENAEDGKKIGIFDGPVPFSSTDLIINNQWQRKVSGFWTHVYAGADYADKNQGVVAVDIEGMYQGGRYNTPTKAGGVTIIAEDNFKLTLKAADGSLFYFDVPGEAFIYSLMDNVSTLTPAPTYPQVTPFCLITPIAPPVKDAPYP